MTRLEKLREQRNTAHEKAKALADVAEQEERDLSDDEVQQIDKLTAECKRLGTQINTLQSLDDQSTSLDQPDPATADVEPADVRVTAGITESEVKETGGFKNLGEFGQCVLQASMGRQVDDPRWQRWTSVTGMSSGSFADGGALVPKRFADAVWEGIEDNEQSLLSMCDVYTVEGDILTMPAVDATTRASGVVMGGITAYWTGEGGQITSSKPKTRQIDLKPKKLAVLIYATDELLSNTQALTRLLERGGASAIVSATNEAVINGTGAGQPLGILNGPATVEITKETSQTADTVVDGNIRKMYARIAPSLRANMVWLAHPDTEPYLDAMYNLIQNVAGSENVGAASIPLYDPNKGLLKGKKVIFNDHCQTVGTAGDIIAFAPSAYAVGVKGGVEAAKSMHLRFDYAEMAFRYIFKVDGQPWLSNPLTPAHGSNTLTGYATVADRS